MLALGNWQEGLGAAEPKEPFALQKGMSLPAVHVVSEAQETDNGP